MIKPDKLNFLTAGMPLQTDKRGYQSAFEILKDMLETNQYHAAILSRIESKIDSNVWCPVLRKEVTNK